MAIDAVIFDLDGTIASFNLDYKSVRSDVRGFLTQKGVPASVLAVNENIFEMLKKADLYFQNHNKNPQVFLEIQKEALAIAEKYEIDAASTTNLMPGVNETLKTLKQMNIKVGLSTLNCCRAAEIILKRFKIDECFQGVVCRNHVQNFKPHPETFEVVMKSLNVKPKATLIVGDSIIDMQSAAELKAVAVGIPTGTATIEQLKSLGANYIITAISDLPLLIKELNKP
jgi:pyrophosphatase PpaX